MLLACVFWLLFPIAFTSKVNLVRNYFCYKGVRYVTLMSCNVYDIKKLSLHMMKRGIAVSTILINNKLEDSLLKRSMSNKLLPMGVYLDLECGDDALILASQLNLFDSNHMWLVASSAQNTTEEYIHSYFDNLNLSINTDVLVAVSTYNGHKYELYDIFNFGKIQGNHLEISYLGRWCNESGLEIYLQKYTYYNRWNFHNLTLRAISVVLGEAKDTFTPSMLTDINFTKGVSAMTKISSIILNIFKDNHNFKFNYTIADRWVGSPVKNSSLAVTNSMYWKQQDISSTCLRIFSKWLDWMDPFFPPTTFLETKFYYRIPSTGVGDYENRFLQPLTNTVWWCSLAALTVCGAVLSLGAYLEGRPRPISYAVFSVTATTCQQDFQDGEDSTTYSNSSQGRRGVLLVAGISSMLLYNYYTSSVVSWLLNAAPPTIDSLDGLMASNLELVFEDIGYTRSWLESPGFYYYKGYPWPKEDELRERKVNKAKRTVNLLQSIDDGIELVRKGGYAYHTEPYNANMRISRTFNQQMLCELGTLQMMSPAPVFIVAQRRSPYKEFFSWSMMRANERGHVSYARKKVTGETPSCEGGTPRALSLGQAAPAFAVLVYGMMLSLVFLIAEILAHFVRNRGKIRYLN